MSIFERLVKEETVSLKNVKISKSIYDLITEVSKKYKVEQSEIVKTLIESSKQKLIEDLNGKSKAAKSKKTEEK
jgi:propanediol utilization protein